MKPKQRTEEAAGNDPTEFSSAIIKIAVSQICQSIGFKAAQLSALDLLGDLAARHLRSIGRSAVSFAIAGNRTEPNVFDIVNALNDLNSVSGFSGASDLHKSDDLLLDSGTFSDLVRFVERSLEIPFTRPISRLRSSDSSVSAVPCNVSRQESSASCPDHVPSWLPDFPDSSAFKESREELDQLKKRKYELWGDAVASRTNDGSSTTCAEKRRAQTITKNGKQMGKVKFKIARVKKGLNGTSCKELVKWCGK